MLFDERDKVLEEYQNFAMRRIRELETENMRLRQALAQHVSKSVYKRLQTQLSATKSVE